MKGEINVGATIFTFVLGMFIVIFFAWTKKNGQRRDREIALGIYPGIKKERAGGDVKSDAKLSAHPKNIEYPPRGKQLRPLFGPFVYRDDRRLSSNRRARRDPC